MVYVDDDLFVDCETRASKFSKLKAITFSEVFLSLKNYIENQLENGKACSIGGFGKFTFKTERMDLGTQGVTERRYPVFVMSENFARANNLRISKPHVSSEIPVTEVNYFLIAQRASTLKEVVTACLKILFAILGDKMSTGQKVSMDLQVGKLVSDRKIVEFTFIKKFTAPLEFRRDKDGGLSATRSSFSPTRPATMQSQVLQGAAGPSSSIDSFADAMGVPRSRPATAAAALQHLQQPPGTPSASGPRAFLSITGRENLQSRGGDADYSSGDHIPRPQSSAGSEILVLMDDDGRPRTANGRFTSLSDYPSSPSQLFKDLPAEYLINDDPDQPQLASPLVAAPSPSHSSLSQRPATAASSLGGSQSSSLSSSSRRNPFRGILGPPFLPRNERGRRHASQDECAVSNYDMVLSHEEQIAQRKESERMQQDAEAEEGKRTLRASQFAVYIEKKRSDERRDELARIAEANKSKAEEKAMRSKSERLELTSFFPPSPSNSGQMSPGGSSFSGSSSQKSFLPHEDEGEAKRKSQQKKSEFRSGLDDQVSIQAAIRASRLEEAKQRQQAVEEELHELEQFLETRRPKISHPLDETKPAFALSAKLASTMNGSRRVRQDNVDSAMQEAYDRYSSTLSAVQFEDAKIMAQEQQFLDVASKAEVARQDERRKRHAENLAMLKKQMEDSLRRRQADEADRKSPSKDLFASKPASFEEIKAEEREVDRRKREASKKVLEDQMRDNFVRKIEEKKSEMESEIKLVDKATKDLERARRDELMRKLETTAALSNSWNKQHEIKDLAMSATKNSNLHSGFGLGTVHINNRS